MDDALVFAEESEEQDSKPSLRKWKVIIADDEPEVHNVTKMVLASYTFDGRGLDFISAYTGREAVETVRTNPDAAIILLDVVMEENDSGLQVVKWIRERLNNTFIRIILRTGQPGHAPEKLVIDNYDINDYKEKTELTDQKLYTSIMVGLRTYRDLISIEKSRLGLIQIIKASSRMFEFQSLRTFTQGILIQLSSLLNIDDSVLYMQSSGFAMSNVNDELIILAATGEYSGHEGNNPEKVLDQHSLDLINKSLKDRKDVFTNNLYVGYFCTTHGSENLLFLKCGHKFNKLDLELIRTFSINISSAFDNLFLTKDIDSTQKEVINVLGEIVENRDNEIGQHVKVVGELTYFFALKYGMSPREADILRMASPMHDVGKIGISEDILKKPGKLTEEEMLLVKGHSQIGYNLLKSSSKSVLRAAAVISLGHHERWDGKGYPRGLQGKDIHIYARITCLTDAIVSLKSKLVYHAPWTDQELKEHLILERGKAFDPELIDLALRHYEEVLSFCSDL